MRLIIAALAAAPFLTGCASPGAAQNPSEETAALETEVTNLQRELGDRERELAQRASEVSRLSERLEDANRATPQRNGDALKVEGGELLPPGAKPGECYARVHIPATYETKSERVVKRAASEKLEVIPARYESLEERVLVKEASTRLEVIPAVYGTVEEAVLVSAESSRLEQIPAQYDWEEERVLVKAAHTVWKKGRGPIERVSDATGEIMCLVEVPAEYKTVRRRVMTQPPSTRVVPIPAQYKTVKRRVLKTPPTTREITIPAEYKTVSVRRQAEPAKERRIEIPAEYQTVSRRELVSDGKMDWRAVLCETNASPAVVAQIQRALKSEGHDPGAIDGQIGRGTLAAVTSYQNAKGLPRGGLNFETIASLGVKLGN